MRILIYGAGVIGSLYAVLFAEAGYNTSIYARGKRLEILKNDGLLYKKNQDLIKAKIKIIEEVPNDTFCALRRSQMRYRTAALRSITAACF